MNQETNLKHPGDTCWGSYYGTILNLILIFSVVVDVLKIIEEDGLSNQKFEARSIMRAIALPKKKKSRYSKYYGSC